MTTWTPEAIQALGATTDLLTLASIAGCSRWKAYQMARTGEWETLGIKIVRLGSKYRVIVPSIIRVLGYADGAASAAASHHQPLPNLDSGTGCAQ